MDAHLEQRGELSRSSLSDPGSDQFVIPLKGSGAPAYPPECPVCGASAASTLTVERVHTYQVEEDESYRTVHDVLRERIPFCPACIARHRSELPAPDGSVFLRRFLKGDGTTLGGAVVVLFALFFVKEAVVKLSWGPLVIAALPMLIGGSMLRSTYRKNAYLAAIPLTSVTRTVEFTAGLAYEFEPFWRLFRFQRAAYTDRFRHLNAARLWDPHGTEAREARRRRIAAESRRNLILYVIVGLVVAWGIWDEFLKPLWHSEWVQVLLHR